VCSGIATKYNLCKNIKIIAVRTEFEKLKVKVPNICLGKAGVLLRWEERYTIPQQYSSANRSWL
jgi:hypothetical protein